MTKEDELLSNIELAKKLQDDKLLIDGLLIALMICRRKSLSTWNRGLEEVMKDIHTSIQKIQKNEFDFPAFIEKECK